MDGMWILPWSNLSMPVGPVGHILAKGPVESGDDLYADKMRWSTTSRAQGALIDAIASKHSIAAYE